MKRSGNYGKEGRLQSHIIDKLLTIIPDTIKNLNMLHPRFYFKTVLSDVNYFIREMQNITEADVLEARRLIRTFPQCPLIRFDSERPMILKKFIQLIGDGLKDISDLDIEGWLKNFKTEALLTP